MIARGIAPFLEGCLGAVEEADQPKSGVAIRIEELALERVEPPSEDIRLRGLQAAGQPLEPLAIRGIEVDLNRFADAGWVRGIVMNRYHES
ncbi:MAG: hypothetical protein WEG36_09740 [Gemmatimonadota bacterium]